MASRFYIINEKGERWDLNSPESGVFTQPKGFGVEYDNTYLRVGDVWMPDDRKLAQPAISGVILFPLQMYGTFQSFANFLNTARELTFAYQPAGVSEEYFADIDVINIDKGSYNRSQQFEVPVKFMCRSLFHKEKRFEYRIKRADKELRWDFRWETKFNDMNYVYFNYTNDGHAESPFILSFTGHCTNPVMMVYQDRKLVGQVRFGLTLKSDEKLVLSTFDDDLFIEINGADGKGCLDFTNSNFFKLPAGESEIYFRQETGKMNNILLSLEKFYKAV